MREPVEDVADGKHRKRVRDNRRRDIGGAEQHRDGVTHHVHDSKTHEAERDRHHVVGVAQPSHRAQITCPAVDADERLAAVADALDHDLNEIGDVGDSGIRCQSGLTAVIRQRDVVDDRRYLGKQRQAERRRAKLDDVRANSAVGNEVAQGHAVISVQEKTEHEQEGDDLSHHRGLGGARRAALPYHHEQVVEHHVHQTRENLHAHGEGHHALVTDKRRATGDQHLERRAEGDDLQVINGLRKGFALASQRPAQLFGEQRVHRQNRKRGHHEHEQGDADDALRTLRIAPAAGDGADDAAAHAKARSHRQYEANQRISNVNARKAGVADGMADEDAVDDAIDPCQRERERGGQDVLQVFRDHRARDHAFPPVFGP